MDGTLTIIDGDDRIELVPWATKHDPFPDHPCRCGGRYVIGVPADECGTTITRAYLLIALHSQPPCETFSRLDLEDPVLWLRTGVIRRERAPIVAGKR